MGQEHAGSAWGPVLAAAAAEAGATALEYVGPAAAAAGAPAPGTGADAAPGGTGDAAAGPAGGPAAGAAHEPSACLGTGAGAVLWASADDPGLAGGLGGWLQACATALGLAGGGPAPATPPPADAVALAFRTAGGAGVTLWATPAVLGATDPVQAEYPQLGGASGARSAAGAGIDLLLEVPMVLTVELGRTERQIREVLGLQPGSILELDRLAGEPVDLMVNGHLIAHAEVVVVDENFGVRITDIVSPSERIDQMQDRT